MAFGLPVEGDDGPFLGDSVSPAPTCDVGRSVADARRALAGSGADSLVVVDGEGLALGEADAEALEGVDGASAVLDAMRPVPSTIRPSVTVTSVAEAGGGRRLVTSSDGRLLGQTTVEAAAAGDHDHHDHDHHDHGEVSLDAASFERDLMEVMSAVQERFGDREPSPEELRQFLHDRLVDEGRSPEEAAQFLDQLESGDRG